GVRGAERLSGGDRESACEAPGEPDHEEDQASGRTHRGERVDPQLAPDDDGVDELVQLLYDIADEQRHGEGQDDAPRASGDEVGCHEEGRVWGCRTAGNRNGTVIGHGAMSPCYRIDSVR